MSKEKRIIVNVMMFFGLIISLVIHIGMYGNIIQENFYKKIFNKAMTDKKIYFLIFTFYFIASLVICILRRRYDIKNTFIFNCILIAGSCYAVIFILTLFFQGLFEITDKILLFKINLLLIIISMVSSWLSVMISTRDTIVTR